MATEVTRSDQGGGRLAAAIACVIFWFVPLVRYAILRELWEEPSVFYLASEIFEFMLLVSSAPVPFVVQALCCAASWFLLVMALRLIRRPR